MTPVSSGKGPVGVVLELPVAVQIADHRVERARRRGSGTELEHAAVVVRAGERRQSRGFTGLTSCEPFQV